MIIIPNLSDIYFSKTKEYVEEVISCYSNGNCRAAIVSLYSVVICDLLLKLDELSKTFDDKRASDILKKIEKKKENSKTDSKWETDLVEQIYKETKLLNDELYIQTGNLKRLRNLSAHPTFSKDYEYELITPSKEITVSYIKYFIDNLFSKNPIFIKNVIDVLTNDLAQKSNLYENRNHSELKKYLIHRYFNYMDNEMKIYTCKTLWKFCFNSPNDEECMKNIKINRLALEVIFEETDNVITILSNESMVKITSNNKDCLEQLCLFLANYPNAYSILSDDSKLQVSSIVNEVPFFKLVSWFESEGNKEEHTKKIIKELKNHRVTSCFSEKFLDYKFITQQLCFIRDIYINEGYKSLFIDLLLELYSKVYCFDSADWIFDNYISNSLSSMSENQLFALVKITNENNQIYNRGRARDTNNLIYKAIEKISKNFDYSEYTNFSCNCNLDKKMTSFAFVGEH